MTSWQDDALCLEYPDVDFFPGQGEDVRPALAVCARCSVAAECLDFARGQPANPPGVWGGTTEWQRRSHRVGRPPGPEPLARKPDAMRDVLALHAAGLSNRAIARTLGYHHRTVNTAMREYREQAS
jgi:WhiB family redox-sensing transcriptional regulator